MSRNDESSKAEVNRTELPQVAAPGRPGGNFGHGRGKVEKPKHFKKTLTRMWSYIGKEKKWLLVVFVLILIDSLLTLSVPYLVGAAVDTMAGGFHAVDFKWLEIVVIALAAAYLGNASLTFLEGWLMAGISQRVVMVLRRAMFGKLQKLPLSFFDTRTHGELMSRLTNDIDNVSNTISQTTTQLMTGLIAIVGSLVMMLVLSPLLTLAALITVPLVYWLTRTITKRTRVLFRGQQTQLGRLNGHIEETISGIDVIKAFNHENKAVAEFDRVNLKLYQVGLKAQIWSGFLMPIMGVINNIGFATVVTVGGILAVKGSITVGVIASFLSYSRQFVRPLNDLANMFNTLQSGIAGAERVFEVLDEQEEPSDSPEAVELVDSKGEVVFENVSFGYRSDVPILQHINFSSEAGSSTALVGPTGAGKTTIVNLLTRFYDVTEGRILIDGIDIREYTRDSLRKCFGIVLQDTYLFSGPIRDNIKYGKPEATDEEMMAAAKMANAHRFIQKLPRQYDTMLSENGGNLSHGQRQLLAIARVILAGPTILILDEATSSIDTRTELHIQDALLKVMDGRTSFIIAHRLNTIRDADTIMVIDHGQIAEQASHDALIERKGVYYQMFTNQFRNIVSE